MFLMYVDESGDCGLVGSPTQYFVLTGLVVHELRWRTTLDTLIDFRRRMKARFGLKLREEIHAAHFINSPGELKRIPRHERLLILRLFADELARIPDLNIINVVVNKAGRTAGYDVFESSWMTLLQRFENTIRARNFPGPANADERGMVLPDQTDMGKVTQLLRRMRRFNPIPSQFGFTGYRNLLVNNIIEDPFFKLSHQSLFTQAVDVAAYFLYQTLAPNSFIKKQGARNYFSRLDPILCKHASRTDPRGVVRL